MSPPNSSLSVFTQDGLVWVKIQGCATFGCSQHFKRVMEALQERGLRCFVLDLTKCLLMDSTFLGILAGVVTSLRKESPEATLSVLNPSPRVLELIGSLGIDNFFHVLRQEPVGTEGMAPIEVEAPAVDKRATTVICLESHRLLAQVNPANAAKFKDVIRFLEEDLKKKAP